jgi:hypothetical protein
MPPRQRLSMSIFFGGGSSMLPQSRLKATASAIGDSMVRMRNHALFSRKTLLFHYDLDKESWGADYPFEFDDDGLLLGPGLTPVIPPSEVHEGMVIDSVMVVGSEDPRDDGTVQLTISALGRVPPHDVIVLNPDYPELEVFTIRFSGLSNTYEVHQGRLEIVELTDADFR